MTLILPSTKISPADTLFLFRASDCIDEEGIFARSYGRRLGGTFSRGSRKVVADSRGALVRLPNAAPPLAWMGGEPGMLLEPQRTNLCIRSEEFGSWTNVSTTVAADAILAPDGALTADLLTAGGSVGAYREQNVTFTGDGEKCFSIHLKAGTSTSSRIIVIGAAIRHDVFVTWLSGVPSLSTNAGAGTLYPVESLGSGWYRLLISATGIVAADSNRVRIYPDRNIGTNSVYAWGAQAEDAVVPSSYIKTEGSTVTRNADSLYFPYTPPPQALTVYVRGVNRGQYAADGLTTRVAHIGAANPSTSSRLSLFSQSTGAPGSQYDDGTSNRLSLTGTVPAIGSVVEHRMTLSATGVVQTSVSVNAAAEVVASASASGPFAGSFADARIYLAGLSTGEVPKTHTHIAVAAGERDLTTMRALAGV